MRPRSRLGTSYDGHHDSANGKTTEKATAPRVCTCAWLHCGTTAINLESLPGIIEQTALNARPLASHARVEDKRARVFKAAITRTPARIAWLPDCGPTRGAACEERQEESQLLRSAQRLLLWKLEGHLSFFSCKCLHLYAIQYTLQWTIIKYKKIFRYF